MQLKKSCKNIIIHLNPLRLFHRKNIDRNRTHFLLKLPQKKQLEINGIFNRLFFDQFV